MLPRQTLPRPMRRSIHPPKAEGLVGMTRAGLARLGRPVRGRTAASRALGLLALVASLASLASVRCADVDRGLGGACIRNEDCLSGVCAGQTCVAAPVVFDATDTTSAPDAAADGAPNGDATPDAAATGMDSGPPPPHDSGSVAPDASTDAHSTQDASVASDASDASHLADASGTHDASSAHDAAHDTGSTPHDSGSTMDAPAKAADASGDSGLADAHPASG